MVINKCGHPEKSTLSKLKTFRKHTKEIRQLTDEWNQKLIKHQEDGYKHHEFLNLNTETDRYLLLDYIKSEPVRGPFTKPHEIDVHRSVYQYTTKSTTYTTLCDMHYNRIISHW